MIPNYSCPQCHGELEKYAGDADYECQRCGVLIRERDEKLIIEIEPDSHGSRQEVYRQNDVTEGMDHD